MPWVLSSRPHQPSPSPSQRHCERTAFAFYCAVRDQLPPWLLEDMRGMEVFLWDDGHPRAFSPGDALMYALVHDHRDYARYLLRSFSVKALQVSKCSVCRSAGSAHLHVAVRYNRTVILSLMADALKESATEAWRREYLNSCGGCTHGTDAGKTAVQLAVELSRADCLLLLLAHGARPHALDAALVRLAASGVTERRDARRCLDLLLLFTPEPVALHRLRDEPQRWQSLLGRDVFSWLSGLVPPPLLLQALRTLAQSVPGQMSELPNFLQPHSELKLDFPLLWKQTEI
ncbi:ankyrin repeat domain-containing protein 9 [Corythoichthys intestinalis]|uniref:ankyrin repeat domain-containing protein 9 n=1 Tax=Corythoichthys intestinalis TaxID=161448 RepID=UPI0025A62A4A|nr:ankyrin repeat domain-containing protein 9 [Corythoichthys intestinalis]XP_061798719.1 ankyrin repeat domain-containing protein 9-like [Nerophis lumbriciformis]